MTLNFTCPYCGRPTTITGPNHFEHWKKIDIEESDKGDLGLFFQAITCPNTKCKKLWLHLALCKAYMGPYSSNWDRSTVIREWQLLPESEAKVLPDYVPQPIRDGYYEACRIRDLSPKASATLSRRCLQGMIRDFWKISMRTLKEDIDALEDKVSSDTWESIEAVRKVGKIGAHMEKDIDLIVDVEPKEAQLLIGLIEQLIDDWYVTREDRKKRTEALKKLVEVKEEKRKSYKNGKS